MSASLVGSEMCIRDRQSALRLRCRMERAFAPSTPMHGMACPQCAEDAVSYTHLTLPTICSV
eukprot:9484746-Alexandrium_andersonii.AAC.1